MQNGGGIPALSHFQPQLAQLRSSMLQSNMSTCRLLNPNTCDQIVWVLRWRNRVTGLSMSSNSFQPCTNIHMLMSMHTCTRTHAEQIIQSVQQSVGHCLLSLLFANSHSAPGLTVILNSHVSIPRLAVYPETGRL